MNAYEIVGIAVGSTVLATFIGRVLWAVHKGVNLIERLADKVHEIDATLKNGIGTDIRIAKDKAAQAVELAADAARQVSVVDQRTEDLQRAINALSADVDVYTNVVLTDRKRIRARLRQEGIDLPDDDGRSDDT